MSKLNAMEKAVIRTECKQELAKLSGRIAPEDLERLSEKLRMSRDGRQVCIAAEIQKDGSYLVLIDDEPIETDKERLR